MPSLQRFIWLWCKAASGLSDDGQVPRFVPVKELFRGRHFDQEIVVLCVRWYLSFKLSYRDLVSMMGERGIDLAHTTILRCTALHTGIRKALEPVRQNGWRFLAHG